MSKKPWEDQTWRMDGIRVWCDRREIARATDRDSQRLIATAPDLYRALELCLRDAPGAREYAEIALRKARGET